MKNRKEIALNKLFNSFVILALLAVWGSIYFFENDDIIGGLILAFIALLLIVIPGIFTPYCYAFDSEGVSLCYLFLPNERYLWKNIHTIEATQRIISSLSADIFDLLYQFVFSIRGKAEGETRFYMSGYIRKTFRTKHLIEKYWDGKISGLFLEEVKDWFRARKHKKEWEIKAHLTDEVAPMEREVRAEAKELLEPFVAQAKQYDLDIKSKFLYITKDFKELRSRPKEGYTYTLVSEISHFDETDENRIVVVSVDLLYVRLGKKAYRGVKSNVLKEELEFTYSDVLNEIYKNGIEIYCKNN